jgi:outer membrane receptor protein involved in Fe transport
MKMKMVVKCAAVLLTLFVFSTSYAQQTISGTVLDDLGEPLYFAKVVEKGTSNRTLTDDKGKFTLEVSNKTGEISISYASFGTKTMAFNTAEKTDLGKIGLEVETQTLGEVKVVGVSDIVKDRQTPIALSTITASEIQDKLGSQEFPEILNRTPSVYATKQGGGFGDARINVRGFDQRNTAVLINGVPVNDMENGWVYWSNWAGLSDVASAIQVQRGLGSSKLAISSVGGTINVITKAADQKQGGFVSGTYGNNNYLKTTASYSTGLMENKLAFNVLLGRTAGDGYVDGTKFEGYNYYVAMGYEPNEKHSFQVSLTGAPQWHNQRDFAPSLYDYMRYADTTKEDVNIRYNSDWGLRNGEEFSMRRNFYHKPIASLNWEWEFNKKSSLSTVIYGSWGRGGGTGPRGGIVYNDSLGTSVYSSRLKDENGLIRWDDIETYNAGGSFTALNGDVVGGVNPWSAAAVGSTNTAFDGQNVITRSNGYLLRASMNSHNWYGAIMNYENKLSDKLTLDVGIDARMYRGLHYRTVVDLLGADAYYSTGNSTLDEGAYYTADNLIQANTITSSMNASKHAQINYSNDGLVKWIGAFGQLEYVGARVSAFVQGAFSNQNFQRIDYFYPTLDTVTNQLVEESEIQNSLGGNIKGGVNYKLDEKHNIYVNGGYYSKQPLFDAVYPNNRQALNPNLTNEDIIGIELGYGLRLQKITANVNLYRTSWSDRYLTISADDIGGNDATANLLGVTQVHMGGEIDLRYRINSKLVAFGMFSYGNWEYAGNVEMQFIDEDNNLTSVDVDGDGAADNTLHLDGVKVGDAAQMTARIGLDYRVYKGLKLDGSFLFADQLYADIDPTSFIRQDHEGSLRLPSFGLMDLGASYKMYLGKKRNQSLNFRVNVNNVLNKTYISEAETNIHAQTAADFATDAEYQDYLNNNTYEGIDASNRVFFGFGRTWNVSVRYNF